MSFRGPESGSSYSHLLVTRREDREYLDDLLWGNEYDEIGRLPGFGIIRRRDTFTARNVDCLVHVFGSNRFDGTEVVPDEGILYALRQMQEAIRQSDEVGTARRGDIVTYSIEEGYITHVGRAIDWIMVESKFGYYSHIYQHPIEMVTTSYGDIVRVYRRR